MNVEERTSKQTLFITFLEVLKIGYCRCSRHFLSTFDPVKRIECNVLMPVSTEASTIKKSAKRAAPARLSLRSAPDAKVAKPAEKRKSFSGM